MTMLQLYDAQISGNCYKVRLMLAELGREYRAIPVDLTSGEPPPEPLRTGNPAGRVPLLVLDDGSTLAESNAILTWLARGTPWLPDDPYAQAKVFQWLFFEQNLHEPNVAGARFLARYADPRQVVPEVLEHLRRRGADAVRRLERHLAGREWLVGDAITIADVALYPYTRTAEEGGISLDGCDAIRAWFDRIESRPRWIPQ